jgi:hypothetical protein
MPHPEITVGSLTVAKRSSGVCDLGEVGVCYEVYRLGDRPGYSFIFERGGYDGFSPDDVKMFLDMTGLVASEMTSYRFRNVGQLDADYRAGRFDGAFEEGRDLDAAYRAGPDARDMLKREWDRAATNPRDKALEKHGGTLEVEATERFWPVAREQQPDTSYERRDRQAIRAYEEHCKMHGLPPKQTDRDEWLREWRGPDEEQRQDAVHMERGQPLHWPQARDEKKATGEHEPDRGPDTDIDR